MHTQKVLDRTGHTSHAFDPADALSTEQAMTRFNELVGREKYVALTPGKNGAPGRLLREFDPTVEETIFHRQLIGG